MYKRNSKLRILVLAFILTITTEKTIAQYVDNVSGYSTINLGSTLENSRIDEVLIDPNWGVAPSQQGNNVDMWGQQIERNTINTTPTQMFDIYGNPVLVDNNGNIVYDAQGNAMVDSAALNNMNNNQTSGILPPDNPIDVPLDGGIAVLLSLATFLGYVKRKHL